MADQNQNPNPAGGTTPVAGNIAFPTPTPVQPPEAAASTTHVVTPTAMLPPIFSSVHPALVRKAQQVEAAMKAMGFSIKFIQGLRTAEYQHELWLHGRTPDGLTVNPKEIVTNCDGYKLKSNHQAKADGLGHALDACFLDHNGVPSWDDHWPWKAYGECAKALGCVWGGDFQTLADLGHIELKLVV